MRRRGVCSYQIFFIPKFNACRVILAAAKVRVTRKGSRNILPRKILWKEALEKMNWSWLDSCNSKSSLYHLTFLGFSLEIVTHYHLQEYRKGWMDKYGSRAHRRWTVADTVSVVKKSFLAPFKRMWVYTSNILQLWLSPGACRCGFWITSLP